MTGDGDGHASLEELAVGWALHALEPADEQQFAEHLPGCASCRHEVEAYEQTLAELALAAPGTAEPTDAWQRLSDRLATTESVPAPRHRGRRSGERAGPGTISLDDARARLSRRSTQLLAAASVVVVLVVAGMAGWNIALRSQTGRLQNSADRQGQVLHSLLRDNTRVALRGQNGAILGYVLTRPGAVDVVSDAMPANNVASSTYVLWATSSSGAPTALGTFDISGHGFTVDSMKATTASITGMTGFAVSKERGRRAPAAPTSVLARGSTV